MPRLNNRRGAALVWAVCALLILAIGATALAGSALSYHRRAMGDEYARQARLTARSATDTLLAALGQAATPQAATPQAAYAALLAAHPWLPPVGGSQGHTDFTLDLSPLGGTVEALHLACRSEDGAIALAITAQAVMGGRQAQMTLHARLAREAGGYTWSVDYYE